MVFVFLLCYLEPGHSCLSSLTYYSYMHWFPFSVFIYHYFTLLRFFFYIIVSWRSFTGVWMTAILLFFVFGSILIMLLSKWSLLVLLFPSLPITIGITVNFMFHSFLFSCKVLVEIAFFHTRLFFSGIWLTTSLLRSPSLFSVFEPISAMVLSLWSRLFLSFLNPTQYFPSPRGLFLERHLLLASPLPYSSTAFSALW